jgi:predicted nuclease of predicted toxin-antitoxin system
MRFLADESCDFAVVRALRVDGHDVEAVAETAPQADDEAVLKLSMSHGQILLTEDKDFGQLVYTSGGTSGGVILMRYPATARSGMAEEVLRLISELEERLIGRFVVVQPGRTRIGPESMG